MRTVMMALLLTGCCLAQPSLTRQELYTALEKASSVELVSLDPSEGIVTGPDWKEKLAELRKRPSLGGYQMLGKQVLQGPEKAALIAAFEAGIDNKTDRDRGKCFIPHHGLRVVYQKREYQVVICYLCLAVKATCGERSFFALTTAEPEPQFRALVTRYKLPTKR